MRERGLDCVIVPGGPNHWSFGSGMLWLSGHREWHAMANYVVFPLEGEPTLVYSMGGAHIEATRKESAIKDVRQSRGGRFAEVMIERIKELSLERGRIGLLPSPLTACSASSSAIRLSLPRANRNASTLSVGADGGN